MCPQGKKRVDAFLSEHTTHSSIWKHNIIPYDQSYEFIYKLSQHFFFCIGTSQKSLLLVFTNFNLNWIKI